MEVSSCQPHLQCIQIELISYEDAMLLKAILQQDDGKVLEQDRSGSSRWSELLGAS